MLTTEIWGFAYPEVGDPQFSMVPYSIPAGAPNLFDQLSQKEKISPGIPSLLLKQVKSENLHNFFLHSRCSFN